jgi:ADP-ribose pyrophosphatase YjhB (NUDIX family)
VPGGGVEEGESVQETAVREVNEETGLDVVYVRTLGTIEGSHYVQATPAGPTRETWRHRRPESDVVICRWLPVTADAEVWGLRGTFLHALVRKRVVAYVTRERGGRTELLVFDEEDAPDVPTQVPAGRIDSHESLEEGLHREVEEETGLTGIRLVAELADPRKFEQLYGPGAHESHAFHAVAEAGGPDNWEHHVTGTGMDAGFVFLCRWVPLDDCPPLWGEADPLVEELRRSITRA